MQLLETTENMKVLLVAPMPPPWGGMATCSEAIVRGVGRIEGCSIEVHLIRFTGLLAESLSDSSIVLDLAGIVSLGSRLAGLLVGLLLICLTFD